uniref:Uncharacterized protein n=1 Tax=Fundidesulfovibrio putealis TaxID=270496 RepID=A0A7C4AGV2_9BACT
MKQHAKTTRHGLIDRLNEIAGAAGINEFIVRRVEREALALRHADPAGASIVLGAAACLKGDLQTMHSHHRKAISLGGGAYAQFQYAISLGRVGLLAESLAHAEQGHELDPLYAEGIELVIGAALALGLKSRAKDYAARWARLHPEKPPYITDTEIDALKGEVRPDVAATVEDLLAGHKDLWSALSRQ